MHVDALGCALCSGERGRQLAGSLVRARDLVVRTPERGRQPRGQPRVAHCLLPRKRAKPQGFTGLVDLQQHTHLYLQAALYLVYSLGAAACLASRRHGHDHATAERQSAACCNIGMRTASAVACQLGRVCPMMALPALKPLARRCLHAHGAAPCQSPARTARSPPALSRPAVVASVSAMVRRCRRDSAIWSASSRTTSCERLSVVRCGCAASASRSSTPAQHSAAWSRAHRWVLAARHGCLQP